MDEFQRAARIITLCTITDTSRMCGHFACRRAARLLKEVYANGMLEAQITYTLSGAHRLHVGGLEVIARARALKAEAKEIE